MGRNLLSAFADPIRLSFQGTGKCILNSLSGIFPFHYHQHQSKKLRDSLLELVKAGTEKEDGYLFHFSSVIYEFLYTLYKHHSQKLSPQARDKENRNFERMEELLQYVRSNYRHEITLSQAAGILNVSPEYFCRLFKKHTGQTFLEYLNAVRLLHFHRELLSTDYSITELMERCGITNYKVFIRSFKETYGTTPGKLRAMDKQ